VSVSVRAEREPASAAPSGAGDAGGPVTAPEARLNFRTIADLGALIAANLHRLARGIDVVAAVPRSGLLPASMIALHLNKPITDIEGLIAGRLLASGSRRGWGDPAEYLGTARHVLVVDDSVLTGTQLARVKSRLGELAVPHRFTYLGVYAAANSTSMVDLHFEVVEVPRVWEWNVMHHHVVLGSACVDIDGILCEDPTEEQNDDGALYERFLAQTPVMYPCTHRVACLVSARLEKYRRQTEDWLARHNVVHDELVLLDLPDKATRQRLGVHASFKAEVYRAHPGTTLFIESHRGQAQKIAQLSGKPVLCLPTREMFAGGGPG
jgi:uncharacterized HAD superfamily protein/hypoxanthine phosphoribosyltransferase